MPTNTKTIDPRESHRKPPFEEPQEAPPGHETEMRTKPDHGEESYRGFGRLKDKAALITGGDSGIGRAVAIAFAREGADVAISYLPEEEKDARETARWVKDAGRKSLEFPGDIRDEQHCRQFVDRVFHEFGRLDILVNNAAFQITHEKLEDFSSEEWDRTFRTNIYAMFYLSKAAIPHMKPGSTIINTASVQAYIRTATCSLTLPPRARLSPSPRLYRNWRPSRVFASTQLRRGQFGRLSFHPQCQRKR